MISDNEVKSLLDEVRETNRRVGQLHVFVFGAEGQGGLNRQIASHEAEDVMRFEAIERTLETHKATRNRFLGGMAVLGGLGAALQWLLDIMRHK